jgi:hypothetical protein
LLLAQFLTIFFTYDPQTRWPSGFDPIKRGAILER